MNPPHPRLSRATLGQLPAGIAVPAYDAASFTAGIVHLGLGNFHRAHMARYTHDLMSHDPAALGWGIVGATLLPGEHRMRDALVPQGCLYTLVERDGVIERTSVIGSICGVIHAGEDSAALLQAIDAPGIRIVSLTVTEHGYCLDPATKRLDPDHELIAADLLSAYPSSAIGILAEAYRRRMASGRPAFTALSCDNIQHNGNVLRGAVVDFARLRDPALADWIIRQARFPNSMVDRITPVTQPGDAAALAARTGVTDAWPVFSETFSQWVIEDDFADGRPAWDKVGAQFVADVTPYEAMKLRLLNASHLAISSPARLVGYTYIDEAMRDPAIRAYMTMLMDRETGPTLGPVPGVDLAAYKAALIDRFANPKIKDTVERVNTDAALNYLLDPIRDRLAAGQPIELLAFAVAAWLRRMRGEDETSAPIPISHPLAALLRERAIEGGPDPMPMLRIVPLFGGLADDERFVASVQQSLRALYEYGAARTLEFLIGA